MIKGCANPECPNNTTGSEYCVQCSAAIQVRARREDPALKALDDEFYPPEMQVGKGPRFYTPPGGWMIQLRPEDVRTESILSPPIRKESWMPPDAVAFKGGGYTYYIWNLEPAPALANMEFVE